MMRVLYCLLGVAFCIAFFVRAEAAELENSSVTGELTYYTTQPKETLYNIARQYDVGIVELMSANPGVDPWLPLEGTELVVPTQHILPSPREGIVINLSEMRLYYFQDSETILTFPIGIGMEGWETVTGATKIVRKRKDPIWTPPDSIRAENPKLPAFIPAGPENPLGAYAMNLGFEGYLIHGTNRPDGIGRRSSHGCIRMYPEDIEVLFHAVDEGTPVTIIDRPYQLGWHRDTLYLAVTPSQDQSDQIVKNRRMHIRDIPAIYNEIKAEVGSGMVDWYAVREAIIWRSGLPTPIATRARTAAR